MYVEFCLALLALSSVTAESDPDCERLSKSLEDQSQVSGRWILNVETADTKEYLDELRIFNSSWMVISPIPDTPVHWVDRVGEKCIYSDANYTVTENTTRVVYNFNSTIHQHVGKYLKTCPDCLVWLGLSVTEGANGEIDKGRTISLLTKSGVLEDAQLEEFKKQAECFNFRQELHFLGTTDLCPAPTDAKAEE